MKMKAFIGTILFAVILLGFFTTSVQAWYNSPDPWSQNQHDPQHTCQGTSTAPSDNSTLWKYWSEGDAKARHLVVESGRVFAIQGGGFFVLDETTGAFVASGTGGGGYGGNVAAAYDNGKLYYTSYDYIYNRGTVYCFNATTYTQLWTYDTSPGQIPQAPTVSDNRVYVGSLNNYTYCIEDGALKWSKNLGSPIYPSPAVDGDLLCVGCDDGRLYAFNVSGEQPVSLWNFTVGTAVRSSITINGDKVFCASEDGYLYAINRTNGNIIWSWKSQGGFGLTIAVAYGIVYVGDLRPGWANHPIYALYANVTAGNYTYTDVEPCVWFDTAAVYGYHGFAVSGNMLFYQSADSIIYARNALTGVHLWSYKCIYITTVPIIADGHVFCADDRQIYCFGPSYPPVTNTYNLNVGRTTFIATAQTNSTIMNIDTSNVTTTKNMTFTVESSQGTGMCNMTLPNSMLGGPYTVTVGGLVPWSYSATTLNTTHTAIYFTYNGTGKYTAQIVGTTAYSNPAVSVQPYSWVMDLGQSKTFTAPSSGGVPPYSYSWSIDWGSQAGTGNTFSFTPSTVGAHTVSVTMTDSLGGTVQSYANVNVSSTLVPPTASASASIVTQGQTSTLTSTAVSTGTGPYSYQWLLKTPGDTSYSAISGAISSSYNFVTSGSTAIGVWSFELQVTDSASSAVLVTSSPISVTVNAPLTVSVTPSSWIMDIGQSKTFSASAAGGSGSYNIYQWYVGGAAQSGQTSSTFAYSPGATGSPSITVTVTDSLGATSAQSSAPIVTVSTALVAPSVSPSASSVAQGDTSTLTASAITTGSSPYTYKWFSQAPGASVYSTISGATSSSYNFATSTSTAAGTWTFILQTTDNAGAAANSTALSVTVNAPTPTPTPTPVPTANPTQAPISTPRPTAAPTHQPTASPLPPPTATPSPSPSPTPTNAPSSALSTEALIAIGGTSVAVIIILVIVLFLFKQKKNKK
jgi:outer membrane protein assembly factor BamB